MLFLLVGHCRALSAITFRALVPATETLDWAGGTCAEMMLPFLSSCDRNGDGKMTMEDEHLSQCAGDAYNCQGGSDVLGSDVCSRLEAGPKFDIHASTVPMCEMVAYDATQSYTFEGSSTSVLSVGGVCSVDTRNRCLGIPTKKFSDPPMAPSPEYRVPLDEHLNCDSNTFLGCLTGPEQPFDRCRIRMDYVEQTDTLQAVCLDYCENWTATADNYAKTCQYGCIISDSKMRKARTCNELVISSHFTGDMCANFEQADHRPCYSDPYSLTCLASSESGCHSGGFPLITVSALVVLALLF